MNLNPGIRLFIRDAIEAGLAAVASLTLTLPANLDDGKKEALVIAVAVSAAVIAVARRELLPIILNWISPSGDQPPAAPPAP